MLNSNELKKDINEAHKRITLLIARVATLEHYVGMRNNHNMSNAVQPYQFRQIACDIQTTGLPRSVTYTKPRE